MDEWVSLLTADQELFSESYGTTTRDSTGSAPYVLELTAGIKVFVRLHADCHIFGNNWISYYRISRKKYIGDTCAFAGYLLW